MAKAKKAKCCRRADGSYEIGALEYIGPNAQGEYTYRLTGYCPFCKSMIQTEVRRLAKYKINLLPPDAKMGAAP